MIKNRSNIIKALKALIALLAVYLFFLWIFQPLLSSDQFINFVESVGVLGYLVVIFYIVISHVFAPVAGSPGVILGVAIYGVNTGMFLLYIASLISATINFFIGRIFGRAAVKKFIGKDAIKEVDKFTEVGGRGLLMVSRLVGYTLFDFISYAAGLTNIKFLDYFLITAVVGLIPNLLIQFIVKDLDMRSSTGFALWITALTISSITFGVTFKYYLNKYHQKRKSATLVD